MGMLLGVIGTAISGFFGFKKSQADAVQASINTLSEVNASNEQREAAIAQIITGESRSGGLAAIWRPLSALVFLGLILMAFFGLAPPYIDHPLSPMMREIFEIFKICLMGYIPARSIEKIVDSLQVGKILNELVKKKLG